MLIKLIKDSEACVSCQMAALLVHGSLYVNNVSICSSIPNCETSLDHCAIMKAAMHLTTMLGKGNPSHRSLAKLIVDANQRCNNAEKFSILATPTNKCVNCILVYDLVEFLQNAFMGSDTENAIESVIYQICLSPLGMLINNLCADRWRILDALFNGFRDSMGGVYDLLAVNALGCPSLNVFLCECLGISC